MNKKVKKAIIPVAGFGTRFIPFTKAMPKEMIPIIDKPTIQYIVEEAVAAGIEDILIVTSSHSNKRAIEDHFDRAVALEVLLKEKNKLEELNQIKELSELANIYFIRQKEPLGLGDAIACGEKFIGQEAFAILLGDDIVTNQEPAILQLINQYELKGKSIIGVQEVEKNQIPKYGIVGTKSNENCALMNDFVEKPKIEEAPSQKAVLGRYVLTSTIFKYLKTQEKGAGNEIQLTDAIKRMMNEEEVYASVFEGKRYDIGGKEGYIKAVIDFGLERADVRETILKHLKELKADGKI